MAEIVVDGFSVDEAPKIFREALLFLDFEVSAGGRDRPLDFSAIAHDACILHQTLHLFRIVAGNARRIEAVESSPKGFALAQDGDPGEPGLETVEDQLLVERTRVPLGHAPFLVVIGDVERVVRRPGAAVAAVLVEEGGAGSRWRFGHANLLAYVPNP